MTESSSSNSHVAPVEEAGLSGARRVALVVFRAVGALTVLAIVVQIVFAGLGAFGDSFEPHRVLGNVLTVLPLLMLILILIARPDRTTGLMSGLLLVLVIVQGILGGLGDDQSAAFGGLHALNALIVLGVTVRLTMRASELLTAERA